MDVFSLRVSFRRVGHTVEIAMVDDVKDENPVWCDPEQMSKYRSHVARCLVFSQVGTEQTQHSP